MTEKYSQNLIQALQLDLDILESLLRRHRCSHGRTLYFRRMSMAHKVLVRSSGILCAFGELQQLRQEIIQENQQRKRKHAREQEQWDTRKDATTEKPISKEERVQKLQSIWIVGIAECTSRIDHASQPLFLEISRGFFLPFCTVALAALARLRTVLLRMGKHGLSQLQDMILSSDRKSLKHCLDKEHIQMAITKYMEEDNKTVSMASSKNSSSSSHNTSGLVGRVSKEEKRPLLLQRLGLMPPKSSSIIASKNDSAGLKALVEEKAEKSRIALTSTTTTTTSFEAATTKITPKDQAFVGGMNQMGALPTLMVEQEAEDLGESMGVALPASAATTLAVETTRKATDGNMEILASLQKYKSKKKKKKDAKMASTEEKLNSNTKKRKETNSESCKFSKKKKKKQTKGDFFDSLFGK